MDPFRKSQRTLQGSSSPIYCVVFDDRDIVDVSKNEYQARILLAQGHSEETAICLFDDLEEETEAMDWESEAGWKRYR
jgi:hypothetical protein